MVKPAAGFFAASYFLGPAMTVSSASQNLFKRHIALPQDHGSWVFLISPLLIGLFAAGSWGPASLYLITGCFAAFLARQPLTVAVKVFSGRRPRRELGPALFWTGVYAAAGLLSLVGLVLWGHSYLLYLAAPGVAVFTLHLYLVSRRAERRQMGVELLATGVLALAAPAAYWVGTGSPDPVGWLLWLLVWLQSAASIVYAYLRLEQRVLDSAPVLSQRLRMGWRALLYSSFNLLLVGGLILLRQLPFPLLLPFALQWAETVWGTTHPAVGVKPTRIGFRQLAVSSLFTLLFILAWAGWGNS
jgi:hypothetical protein